MKLNQRGEGKGGVVFGLFVLFLVIYLAFKIVPVAIHVFAFEDAAKEECKYNGNKKLDFIQDRVYNIGMRELLPIEPEDIQLQKIDNNLHMEVDYSVPIVFPGYTYNWSQHVEYDAPVF